MAKLFPMQNIPYPHHPSFNVRYQTVALCIALLYATMLTALPLEVFKDRANYLIYAENSHEILLAYYFSGWLSTLSNEPAWLLLNISLSLFLTPQQTLRVIIFIPAFVGAYYVLRVSPRHFPILLIFLLLPNVIKNHIIHLRQGFAVAIFLLGWLSQNNIIRWVTILLAPLVHASFFFILIIYVITHVFIKLKLAADLRMLIFGGVAIGSGLMMAIVAQALGARQGAHYDFTATDITGLGFIFWSIILAVYWSQGTTFLRQQAFVVSVLVFYLGTYFFIEVAARIFESALLIVLFAALQLTGGRKLAFYCTIVSFLLYSYMGRLDQPWLGWGGT